jgi:hypothetical protein
MQFWNEAVVDRSWRVLIELQKRYDFILIGGWAVYLLAHTSKSKDIDIIVDHDTLQKMRTEMVVKKSEHLRKYETARDDVSIDIYVPYYSKLTIDISELQKHVRSVEGFSIPSAEYLLLLKLDAEMSRADSIKGMKDRADILSLLISNAVDPAEYEAVIRKHTSKAYSERLKEIVNKSTKEYEYLDIVNYRRIKLIKKKIMKEFDLG